MVTKYYILIANGDGVGGELIDSAITILNTFNQLFVFEYIEIYIGHNQYIKTKQAITCNDIDLFKQHRLLLKGPLTVPHSKHDSYMIDLYNKQYTSANQALRKLCELHCNIRPFISFNNIQTSKFNDIDIVVIRENTEDLYSGIEDITDNGNTATAIKKITRHASLRIARTAFEYAVKHDRNKITAVHKANVWIITITHSKLYILYIIMIT